MNDFEKCLLKFLEEGSLTSEEEKFLVLKVKKIVYSVVSKPSIYEYAKNIYDVNNMVDEVLDETFLKMISNRGSIINAAKRGLNLESYIASLVRNNVIDRLRKKVIHTSEMNDNIEYGVTYKDRLLYMEAREFADISLKNLSSTERKTICLYILSMEESNKSKSAFDKAKSRAKKKLKEFVYKFGFSPEVVEVAIKRFMSEICRKYVNK